MKNTANTFTMTALLGSALLLGACQPKAAPAPVADPAADSAAIHKVLDGIVSSFNAGDYDAMFALYRDDVVVYPPNAPDMVGKQAWREALKGLPPNATAKLSFDTKELVVGGGLAYERGTYKIELTDKATGKPAGEMGGRHVHIFTREADGGWKGWRLMENSADPVK